MTDTPEQAELREAARDFFGTAAASPDPAAHSAARNSAAWKRLAGELGLTGLAVPGELGGAGATLAEVAIAVAEAGRLLSPLPLLPTALAGYLLSRSSGTARHYAERIATSGLRAAFATASEVSVSPDGRLTGVVPNVLHGPGAELLLARAAGAAWLASAGDGVIIVPAGTLDQTRPQATVEFAGAAAVRLDATADHAEDLLRTLLAVESAAAAAHCLDVTVAYLRTREQFGRPLGAFQALRHRAADLAVQVSAATATARAAAAADPARLPVLGPLAKRYCADVFWQVAAEMIQLHGGIGFTWEHQAHWYLKRAKTTQLLHGTPAELRRLVASRAGLVP